MNWQKRTFLILMAASLLVSLGLQWVDQSQAIAGGCPCAGASNCLRCCRQERVDCLELGNPQAVCQAVFDACMACC